MSEELDDLRRKVGETRRGLEEALRRLSDLRQRLDPRRQAEEAAPLFPGLSTGSGAIADTELRFEALDTVAGAEDSKREER